MVTKKAVRFPTLRHFGLRNVFDFSATTKQRKAIRKARVALKRKLAALERIYEGDQKPILREMETIATWPMSYRRSRMGLIRPR